MSQFSFRSSQPDRWSAPRPYSDPTLRRMHYGPIRPMHEPRGFLSRLLGRA
ncbi:hypothetical protein P7228_12735 [Altererythrobacter arenosus]|uniref:Uncharacterized protein n=1 Tax=Altererythrobacter arenosus TaxID=3032592 RepID=A0ABY8FPB7_9SPHN|nr:hypothetical protein [Altererythrobacter sp. CAU 1644]WFL76854.1 hypothetical protein P7228_12735 [Altererythrobacter sp. CAU 1644]